MRDILEGKTKAVAQVNVFDMDQDLDSMISKLEARKEEQIVR